MGGHLTPQMNVGHFMPKTNVGLKSRGSFPADAKTPTKESESLIVELEGNR
jgi:hypothetical protein